MDQSPKPGIWPVTADGFDPIHHNVTPLTKGGSNTDRPTKPEMWIVTLLSSSSLLHTQYHYSVLGDSPHSELESWGPHYNPSRMVAPNKLPKPKSTPVLLHVS